MIVILLALLTGRGRVDSAADFGGVGGEPRASRGVGARLPTPMAGERNVALVASAGAVAAAAVSRAYMRIARPPKLCWHPDGDLERILLRCKALLRPYWPHAFSYGGISSSAAAAVKSIPVPKWTLSSHEELLRLADGGTVSLDWWQSDHIPADELKRPTVHSLEKCLTAVPVKNVHRHLP